MLRRDLALARALEQPHACVLGCDLADDRIRKVGRPVRRDHDLERVLRIVERERVLDAAANDGLLVVGGDDERDRRSLLRLANRPRSETRERSHRERIAGVRPRECAERTPEETLRNHAASISLTSAR